MQFIRKGGKSVNLKRICLVGSIALILLQGQVKAYTEKNITEYTNGLVTTVQGTISEENQILQDYAKDIVIDGKTYTTSSVERNELSDNVKMESKQKVEVLNTNNKEKIRKHFGNTYLFEDKEYKGELPITDIQIRTIDQGSYEEIDEKKINFNNYSQNDLIKIAKEITLNNKTYYLINVDWKPERVQVIDNQEVPITYQGTMKYQTVLTKKNPNKYEVTVTYSGEVSKKDTVYEYSILYQPVEIPEVIEEKEEINIVPIIISGLGIGIVVLLVFLGLGNIKVYNKTDKGNKLIGKFRINKDKKIIDITKYQYKTSSNIYCLKLNNSLYRQMKGKPIYLQVRQIKKLIYINAQYVEVII